MRSHWRSSTVSPRSPPSPGRWRTIDEPDVRRILQRFVTVPRRRNTDPMAPWIDALSLVRLGSRRSGRGRSRATAATSTVSATCTRTTSMRSSVTDSSTSTDRSTGRSRCCSPNRRPVGPPSARAACCWSTSSRTSPRPTCCSFACWRRRGVRCSASATTTRRSTATTVPIRRG